MLVIFRLKITFGCAYIFPQLSSDIALVNVEKFTNDRVQNHLIL